MIFLVAFVVLALSFIFAGFILDAGQRIHERHLSEDEVRERLRNLH